MENELHMHKYFFKEFVKKTEIILIKVLQVRIAQLYQQEFYIYSIFR